MEQPNRIEAIAYVYSDILELTFDNRLLEMLEGTELKEHPLTLFICMSEWPFA